jgi:hypothetical protein
MHQHHHHHQHYCSMRKLEAHLVSDALLLEMSELVSNHYGVWSESAPDVALRGQRVRWTPEKLHREYLQARVVPRMSDNRVFVALAFVDNNNNDADDGTLIGHAIGQEFDTDNAIMGRGIWITQLVVHTEHRSKRVATGLLDMLMLFDSSSSRPLRLAAIASSHPHAIHALASVDACVCYADYIDDPCLAQTVVNAAAAEHVSYLRDKLVVACSCDKCSCGRLHLMIQTGFHVAHPPPPPLPLALGTEHACYFGCLLREGDEHLCILHV